MNNVATERICYVCKKEIDGDYKFIQFEYVCLPCSETDKVKKYLHLVGEFNRMKDRPTQEDIQAIEKYIEENNKVAFATRLGTADIIFEYLGLDKEDIGR